MQPRYYIAALVLIVACALVLLARPERTAVSDAPEAPVARERSVEPAVRQPHTGSNRDRFAVANNLPEDPREATTTANEQAEHSNNGVEAADRSSSIGPLAWMSEVDPEEERRIDELLDQAFNRHAVTQEHHAAHTASSRAANDIVERCYEELVLRDPVATGRLAASWDVRVTADSTELIDAQIDINHGLVEEAFELCVLSGLEGIQLPSVRKLAPITGSIATYGIERAFILEQR